MLPNKLKIYFAKLSKFFNFLCSSTCKSFKLFSPCLLLYTDEARKSISFIYKREGAFSESIENGFSIIFRCSSSSLERVSLLLNSSLRSSMCSAYLIPAANCLSGDIYCEQIRKCINIPFKG